MDPRIPALIRIGYALLVLVNLAALYPNLELWFGESGVLPRKVFLEDYNPALWTLLLWVPPGHVALELCFWVFVAHAVCLLLGIGSRFSAAATFVWLVSFQNRNDLILDGEDKVMRLIGFLLIFMPLAEVFSIDSRLWPRENKGQTTEGESGPSPWAVRVLQFLMVLIMFATGLCKVVGAPWQDGTALYYVARIDDLFGRFPIPHFLFDTPWIVRLLTWSVVVAELLIPITIWIPALRRASLVALLAFHLSNEYTMQLFLFHWIMLCGWISFLSTEDLNWFTGLLRRFRGEKAAPEMLQIADEASAPAGMTPQ